MIVAISGKKGAGKDTVALMISEILSTESEYQKYVYKREAFADPIKSLLMHMFGWGYEVFSPCNKEKKDEDFGISPREALQLLGTEFAQYLLCEKVPEFKEKVGRNFWVKALEREYKAFINNLSFANKTGVLVIPDLRFPHEYDFIKANEGIVIKVVRNDLQSNALSAHESEAHELPYDILIENNGSMAELKWQVVENIDKILQKS